MRALFVINAKSGTRRVDRAAMLSREMRSSGVEGDVIACASKEQLDEILRDTDHEIVVAVGGDGTVSETGKRLAGTERILAIVPTGSGNGFARHLGIPLRAAAAVRAIAGGRVESIDTATVNGVPFLAVCGSGFDGVVAHRFAESAVRGLRTYVRVGFRAWLALEPSEFRVTVDGKTQSCKALLAAVANSAQYGNDARIAPRASLQDGLLDVALVRRIPLLSAPATLAQLFLGSLDRCRWVDSFRGAEITIERESESEAHLDGEPVILPPRMEFAVRPKSLRVLVPRTTQRI